MRVRVLLFAQAREAAGAAETALELADGRSVAQAAAELASRFPALAPHLERSSFAINRRYARRDELLRAGDELAVLPPIGGG